MLDFSTTYLMKALNLEVPSATPVSHIVMLPIWLGEGYWLYRAAFDNPAYRAYGRVVEDTADKVVIVGTGSDIVAAMRYEFQPLTKTLWAGVGRTQEHQELVNKFANDYEVQGFFRMEWADDVLETQSEEVLRKDVRAEHEELKKAGLVPALPASEESGKVESLLREALGDE